MKTKQDYIEFTSFLNALSEGTPGKSPSAKALDLYYRMCSDIELDVIKKNVTAFVQKTGFFPKIADCIGINLSDRTTEAWLVAEKVAMTPRDQSMKEAMVKAGFPELYPWIISRYNEILGSNNPSATRAQLKEEIQFLLSGRDKDSAKEAVKRLDPVTNPQSQIRTPGAMAIGDLVSGIVKNEVKQ